MLRTLPALLSSEPYIMRKRLPPLNWLRAFESAARHLSFTEAASELSLTQAAVSQQIKALESQLGAVLFRRLPRRLELTEAGLAYLPAVHDSIERLGAITHELFGQRHRKALTVKFSLVFFTHWLAALLPRFVSQHPDIHLNIASNIWTSDNSVDADLEIRHGNGKWPGLKCERLTYDTLFPVCAATLPCVAKPLNTPADLRHHSLLHVMGYEEGWGTWLKHAGAPQVDYSQGLQFDTLIAALKMAELGHGVALARSSLVTRLLASGELIAPFDQALETSEAFYLVYAPHRIANPSAALFIDWLLSETRAVQEAPDA